MCNCFFDSFLLQKETYHDIKIVQDVESCLRLTCLPNYKRFTIVDEMLSLVEMKKTSVALNRFPLVGS